MPRPYPPEFRQRALELVRSGRSVAEVAGLLTRPPDSYPNRTPTGKQRRACTNTRFHRGLRHGPPPIPLAQERSRLVPTRAKAIYPVDLHAA